MLINYENSVEKAKHWHFSPMSTIRDKNKSGISNSNISRRGRGGSLSPTATTSTLCVTQRPLYKSEHIHRTQTMDGTIQKG